MSIFIGAEERRSRMIHSPRRQSVRGLHYTRLDILVLVDLRPGAVRTAGVEGKNCVVTGASSGIGRQIALELASSGATVCAIARGREGLEETAKAGDPGRFALFPADLTSDADMARVTRELGARPGALDVLVHSAGTTSLGDLATAAVEDLDRQYAANLRAPFLFTQGLLPALRESQGQIVFINSTAGLTARANAGQFAATQHALKAIADSLREEVNADGIRVLSVYPGRTATPRQERIHALEGKAYFSERLMQPSDVASMVVTAIALPRSAEVTDLRIRPARKP
jgi:NADP-dependent 3-hydroxy acid dehydrogenase YdfG